MLGQPTPQPPCYRTGLAHQAQPRLAQLGQGRGPAFHGAKPLLFFGAELAPAGLAHFGRQSADQQSSANHHHHRRTGESVRGGHQGQAQQQHQGAPSRIPGTAELGR